MPWNQQIACSISADARCCKTRQTLNISAKSKLIIIPADKPKAKVDLTDPTLKEIFGL
jgi:hypothetical protein